MKRLVASVLPLFLSSSAFAIVGGPFGNNTFQGRSGVDNSAGTYQATLSGQDVSGVVIFGTSDSSRATGGSGGGLSSSGSEGRALIFTNGHAVLSQVSSAVNLGGRNISGVISGSKRTSQYPITRTEEPIGNFTVTDVLVVTGFFKAKIRQTFPTYGFEGKGTLNIKVPDASRSFEVRIDGDAAAIVPSYNPNSGEDVRITISGVKTSNTPPNFSGTVTLETSSVVRE